VAIVQRKSAGEHAFDLGNLVFLLAMCVATVYPFVHIIAVSLSGSAVVMRGEITVIPRDLTFAAYKEILGSSVIFNSYQNTLFVVIVGTVLSIFLTAFAAYPLSKSRLVGRGFIVFTIALTMWFNPGMIPRFLVIRDLGLCDTLWAIILSPLMNAYHIIVMRSFFVTIPDSLEESAIIDGAGYWRVLFRIVLPLSKPVIATVALWKAVYYWNAFMEPLLYLQSRAKFTLQLILRDIVLAYSGITFGVGDAVNLQDGLPTIGETIQAGTIIAATLPILLVYPFVQKYFVKGALIGSIKG
jgi:putative aldouronate transport system permease protein